MIPLKRIDHISMGHTDYKAQFAWLERVLGFKYLFTFTMKEGSPFVGGTSQVRGTDVEFEVIEPAGDGFLRRFIDEEGPGLHHIAVETESLDQTIKEMDRLNLTPFGGIADDGDWRFTFIHPSESGGVLWQIFESSATPRDLDRRAGGGLVELLRVDHVSMATQDLDWQLEWQAQVFGFEQENRWEDEELGYKGAVMTHPRSQLRFEMMQPARPDSHIKKFIDTRRPGLHHVCCEVASVDRAVAALREAGIEPHGGIIENAWKKHTFIHPRDSGGVLFQLFEEPQE